MRFLTPIFSWFERIWAPDKQPKKFLISVLFSTRYSITRWSPLCALYPGDDLCGVLHTAEITKYLTFYISKLFFHDICVHPYNSPRCAAHCGKDIRGVHHTAEMIAEVCSTPLRWSQRCAAHRWNDLRGVHHSAEMISAVCIIPLRLSLRCASYRWDDLRRDKLNTAGMKSKYSFASGCF